MPTLDELHRRYDSRPPQDEIDRALNPDTDLVKAKKTVAGWQARVDHALAVIDDPAPGVTVEDALADLRHAEDGLSRAEARMRLIENPGVRTQLAIGEFLGRAAQ